MSSIKRLTDSYVIGDVITEPVTEPDNILIRSPSVQQWQTDPDDPIKPGSVAFNNAYNAYLIREIERQLIAKNKGWR
jgi:hypothetical protein